jgi:toxin ParE1/3/4
MKVLWTRQAQRRLTEIRDFIAQDDPAAADRHLRRLVERAQAVTRFPALGREVPELPGTALRELIEGNYRIVYRVRQRTVEILTVFEAHHLLPLEDLSPAPKI